MRVFLALFAATTAAATTTPLRLANDALRVSWNTNDAGLTNGLVETDAQTLLLGPEVFMLIVRNPSTGQTRAVRSTTLGPANITREETTWLEAQFTVYFDADPAFCGLGDRGPALFVTWEARLGVASVRQTVTVTVPQPAAWLVEEVVFVNTALPAARALDQGGHKGQVMLLPPGLFFGVEHPLADNHHGARTTVLGSIPPVELNTNAARAVTRRVDITSLLQASAGVPFSYLAWVDNWESTVAVEVDGVRLCAENGAGTRVVVVEDNHVAHLARDDTRANIFSLPAVTAEPHPAQYFLEFTVRTQPGATYVAPITFGINRLDHPGHVICSYRRHAQESEVDGGVWQSGFVIGTHRPGQLRRALRAYIDAARPRPAAVNLHWNSWYTLGTGKVGGAVTVKLPFANYSGGQLYNEAAALDAITAIGRELVRKRGVQLDSFLLDDGWDNRESLWHFHAGFPDGLFPAQRVASEYGARVGIWLSPWGGYAGRDTRLNAAEAQGFETQGTGDQRAFRFHAPKYFARFSNISLDFVDRYGVNMFKFDGIGALSRYGAAMPDFTEDFEAMMRLLAAIRSRNTSIFINLSTGTWPSIFWLLHVDCVWRNGHDHEFAGDTSAPPRERWITYRDAMTFQHVVTASPGFPLSALMLHGIIRARDAWDLNDVTADTWHFRNEVRTAFGSGTALQGKITTSTTRQELYITPSLLVDRHWDDIAAAAKWARAAVATLRDVRWIGGNPALGAVYGWAAFDDTRSIITLRNPVTRSAQFALGTFAECFEADNIVWPVCLQAPLLPQRLATLCFESSTASVTVELGPLEVLVFDSNAA